MRRNFSVKTAFAAICMMFASTSISSASTLVIKLTDGTALSYDTALISSMFFADSGSSAGQPAANAPLLTEDFSSGLSNIWEQIQVVGGNFERFAKVSPGKLAVAVPAGNSWGKTGIMSRTPLFSVDAGMADKPLKISFDFDPSATTGYIIALSQAKDADVWRVQNVWFHWGKPTFTEGKAYLVNTQNQGDKGGESKTPALAPRNVTLSIRPGAVEAGTSHNTKTEAQISWLKPGVPVYLYIFSHPWNQHEAASFTLKSIKIIQ